MQFGHPDDFAIEAEVTDNVGRWVYGTLIFHVNGEVVGNADDAADLLAADQEVRRPPPRFRIYTVLTIAFVHPPDRRVIAVA